MTMTIFNLPTDLVEEIFSRVPMKSTRSVCKTLNTLSQSPSFTKLHIGKDAATTKEGETRIIVLMDYNLHLISVVFNGIGTDPFSEHKGKLSCLNDSEQVKISRIFHCEGLLLCILKDDSRFAICGCGRRRSASETNSAASCYLCFLYRETQH
ncbi:putative F-box protein [Cardamine amara subsp. amara]|uniref:F-box protein n=1 Tax=Cardamine amara subsp. amara TaxID=228776 RepID=A0ABD1AXW4_CARAN